MTLVRTPPASDTALLEQIAAGDRTALWELCTRHGAALRAVAFTMLHDAADAERAVQAAFQEVRYEAGRFDPAHFPVLSWLTEVTRTAALARAHPASGRVAS